MNLTDSDERRGATFAWLLGVSIVAHVALFGALGPRDGHHGRARRRPVEVTMEVGPAPPVAPIPLAPAAPKLRATRRLAVRASAPATAAPPASTPAAAEAPAEFSGVTLTNDGAGPGGAAAVGTGGALRGPIGAPRVKIARTPVARDAGPPLVALASLSRAPSPPDLADVLERHYPEAARRQGLSGQAVLKARIPPDGHPRDLVLVSQSTPGFGDACRATLRDSVWTAPLDRDGRAVATLVTYTCRFEVR
jgi:outer membrane biosynthesis protein TonB